MTLTEKRPELDVPSRCQAKLCVERTDITFRDLADDKVRIQIMVRNEGGRRSAPTPMRLESAPLGAFVPWQPLTQLLVPPLEPGESRALSVDVARPRPDPLGDFNRVPPKKLIAAVNAPENSPNSPERQPQTSDTGLLALLNPFRRGRTTQRSDRESAGRGSLAPDLRDLLGRRQPYWAGNINVFIGAHAVERHLAKALRIYPGRTNLAAFMVGDSRKPDAYAFELVGLAAGWEIGLYEMSRSRSLLVNGSHAPIVEARWVESAGGLVVILAMQPPVDCREGSVQVHVTRRSSGKTAIVEFDLDPSAQGTGCYCL